jgi:hypothetical protein
MAKSFQIDLGNGRQPTGAGSLVILLAAIVTFGVGVSFLKWGDQLTGFNPLLGYGIAAGAGVLVLGVGWGVLRLLGVPFSRKKEE